MKRFSLILFLVAVSSVHFTRAQPWPEDLLIKRRSLDSLCYKTFKYTLRVPRYCVSEMNDYHGKFISSCGFDGTNLKCDISMRYGGSSQFSP